MKSILWCISFVIRLLAIVPDLYKADRLAKKGEFKARDELMYKLSKKWGREAIETTGSTIEIIGSELIPEDEAVVFVGNHQSLLDIPLLTGYLKKHTSFIAKKELNKIPILIIGIRNMNSIFIDRGNVRQSLRAINEGAKNIKQGYSYIIFPEGTRSTNGEMLPFKSGALKLATKSKAPIIPITLVGVNQIMPKGTLKVNKVNIKVIISEPIYIDKENSKDTKALSDKVEGIIRNNYVKYK